MDLDSARVALEALEPALAEAVSSDSIEALLDQGERLVQDRPVLQGDPRGFRGPWQEVS